jgi:hypothetical protein
MDAYDKATANYDTYLVGQARILHSNFVDDKSPDAATNYKKKLTEIIALFETGMKLAGQKAGRSRATKTRKRKHRLH